MPLVDLLHRCPLCLHEPMAGRGDSARCPECGTRFGRGARGAGRLKVRSADGVVSERPAAELVEMMRPAGEGRGVGGSAPPSDLARRARGFLRCSPRAEPVRHRGVLLGFAARLGPRAAGAIEASVDGLAFRGDDGTSHRWPVLEVRAILGSSSALQFATPGAVLWQFTFEADSALRWEMLLEEIVRRAWREQGRGEVIEFRPRIVTE